MINYKQILASFLSTVQEFSDPDYQERVWVKGTGPECSSFDEALDRYSNYSDGMIQDYKLFGLSEQQRNEIKKFTIILDHYADTVIYDDVPESKIVNDPEWHKVRHHAKELLLLFNHKEDPDDTIKASSHPL